VHNARNIVHHDIKPENILVTSEDVAKISDFGISAKLVNNESDQIYNHEWGTKNYLPPESWNSRVELTEESAMYGKAMDVWALGCTFYQLIYGVFPFVQSINLQEMAKSITTDE
jgi:[calcium/calmodulin-dependent protein kinase] kinase